MKKFFCEQALNVFQRLNQILARALRAGKGLQIGTNRERCEQKGA